MKWVNKQDAFGLPVGVTLKGKSKFRTLRGGIITLCLKAYIIYLFISKIIPVLLNQIETVSTEVVFNDVSSTEFDPFSTSDFKLAIGTTQPVDPRIAKFSMEYVEEVYSEDTGKVSRKITNIPLGPCAEDSIFHSGVRRISMVCFGDLDPSVRTLTGDFMSKQLKYMKLSFRNCVEPASNASDTQKYCAS